MEDLQRKKRQNNTNLGEVVRKHNKSDWAAPFARRVAAVAPPSSAQVSAAAVATGSLGSCLARSTSGSRVAVVDCGRRSAEVRVICSSVRAPASLSCSSSAHACVKSFCFYSASRIHKTKQVNV